MSNKISSWNDNDSGDSDNSEQCCEPTAGLGRDLPSGFFKSNIYSSNASLYCYEGGKTSSTRTKKAAGSKRATASSPGPASPPHNSSTTEQKRASRGGTQRNTSKGRHKKGKSSQKSSIGGASQPLAPDAAIVKHSSDVRIEESKESILSQAIKVSGAEIAVMPNDHVNTVNYESEGE